MTQQGILGTFASHDFLAGLSERHRMILASGVRPFTASAGEYLAHEGAKSHALFLIQSGHVTLSTTVPGRGEVPILTVGPGEIVGWSWLLPPHRWQFDCRAADEVKGLAFDGEWLRERCEQDYELGYHLLKKLLAVVAGRLAATRLKQAGASR